MMLLNQVQIWTAFYIGHVSDRPAIKCRVNRYDKEGDMHKSVLERFISKYNLAGAANAVLWTVGDELSTKFISDDRSVLGIIRAKDATFDRGEYGIYDTAQLRSLLNPLEEEIQVGVNGVSKKATCLQLKDHAGGDARVMLSDKSVIPSVPDLKALPTFDLEISLDPRFIEKFVKAKNALPNVEIFTVITQDDKTRVIIGYSPNINQSSFALNVNVVKGDGISRPIDFSARYLKEILVANKETTGGTLKVSEKGLAHATFTIDGFVADYYLIEIQSA
jgi:hypothetical protein